MTEFTDDWLTQALAERKKRGLLRVRRRLQTAQGVRVRLGGREYLNFGSNDYLNLASDPRLGRAAAAAALRYGAGSGASPLVAGYSLPLARLERELRAWEECGGALVFPSGYAANLAVLSALAGPGDAIFSDAWNHASVIDGCRLSRAAVHVYPHADMNQLHELLDREAGKYHRRVIVTDTVFSMDGDCAPLADLCDMACRHDCLLVIDEAHATGVLGKQGRGVADGLLVDKHSKHRLIKVGTLSKALGSQGGYVCAQKPIIQWLVNHARPYIYSTALAPPCAAAARRAVAIARADPAARERLLASAARLRLRLREVGYRLSAGTHESTTQIVPVILGEPAAALVAARRLRSLGFLAPAMRPPTVPEGTSRLRISLTTGHSEEHIERLIEALRTVACVQ